MPKTKNEAPRDWKDIKTPEHVQDEIDLTVKIGVAAWRKGDWKTVGEARSWIMFFQTWKQILEEE